MKRSCNRETADSTFFGVNRGPCRPFDIAQSPTHKTILSGVVLYDLQRTSPTFQSEWILADYIGNLPLTGRRISSLYGISDN